MSRAAGTDGTGDETVDDESADDESVDDETGVDVTASTDVVAASPPHAATMGPAARATRAMKRRTEAPYRPVGCLSSRPPIPFVT